MVASTLFNTTVEENQDEIVRKLGGVWAPFGAIFGAVGGISAAASERSSWWTRFALIGGTLAFMGVVYGFLDPDFGFNERSLALFLALVIGMGVVTYLYEGGNVAMLKREGVRATVQPFPASILIAIVFVALCRILDFQPGIVFGFVAAAAVLVPARLSQRAQGEAVLLPALGLLALGVGAWFLAWPLTEALDADSGVWEALPLTIAVGIVAVAVEGLFAVLLPMRFTDGEKLFRWNKLIWFAMFVVAGFLCLQVILQQQEQFFDSLKEAKVLGVVGVVFLYTALGVGTWWYFRRHNAGEEGAGFEELAVDEEPTAPA
jgi:hypothetical protein